MESKEAVPVLLYTLGVLFVLVQADPVLRYKMDSCNSLEPIYVEENWQVPGGGDIEAPDEELFNKSPKKLRKNSAFKIKMDWTQYRRNRQYQVKIETTEYFDAFLLQARGQQQEDGNATLVGFWVAMPPISKYIKCIGKRKSSVVDKGRPVRLGNMTFTWQSPPTDYGQIKFIASIVKGDGYVTVQTKQIAFNPFPVSIRGCGRDMSCFRACHTSPSCPPDESTYMVVMYLSQNREDVVIQMGGVVEDDQKYVAVGFGNDKRSLQSMDVAVCYREGDDIKLGHYLIENDRTQPYLHKSQLTLDGSDVDARKQFIWCQFRRPIQPESQWDLDLSRNMFHFYFMGNKNNSEIYLPEDLSNVWNSGMKRNFSEIVNEIMFSGNAGSICLNSSAIFISSLIILLLTMR